MSIEVCGEPCERYRSEDGPVRCGLLSGHVGSHHFIFSRQPRPRWGVVMSMDGSTASLVFDDEVTGVWCRSREAIEAIAAALNSQGAGK